MCKEFKRKVVPEYDTDESGSETDGYKSDGRGINNENVSLKEIHKEDNRVYAAKVNMVNI